MRISNIISRLRSRQELQISNIWVCLLLLIGLTIPTFWTLLRPGYFPMQDDLQAFRQYEMNQCFLDYQIPCRWIPDMGYQYGYPQFNFYAPSVFYFGEIFRIFNIQFIDIVKILFILGFVFSAISIFLFLRSIFGNFPALVGSLLYSYLPFKAVEVYVRGSISEFWALVFFPLLFWSSYQFISTEKKKYGLYFAGFVGLMFLTHTLMSMLIFPMLTIWVFVLIWQQRKWSLIWKIFGWGVLGFGLAAFFLLPMLTEKQYVHTETLLSGYFDYRQHFVSLKKLFFDNEWGYGSSNLGQTEILNLSTGIVQWVLGFTGFVLAVIFWKKERRISVLVLTIGIMAILSLLMIHQKSALVWSVIPVLVWLQFPWRFLAMSGFFLSILSASAIFYLQRWPKFASGLGILAVFLTLFLSFNFYQPKAWLNITDQDKFSGEFWQKELTISIFDYLPIYAKLPPNHIAPDLPVVLNGQAQFFKYRKRSDYQEGTVAVSSDNATIRLPIFDFPGMSVKAQSFQSLSTESSKPMEINHWNNDCQKEEYCFGLITFKLSQGSYRLRVELENTPIRTLGNLITLLSLLILIVLYFKLQKNKQSLKFLLCSKLWKFFK